MSMGRCFLITLWVLLNSAESYSIVSDSGGTAKDTLEQVRIVKLTYNCDFGEALQCADKMDSADSISLRRDFYGAMVLWREYVYKGSALIRDTAVETRFSNEMRRVIDLGERMLSNTPVDEEALFYTGAGCGYLGELEASNGNYFKSASLGQKALTYHEKLLSINPHYYDAYLTLGLFNFFASSVPWFLKPILFILGRSGSEKKADEYLNLAATRGRLAKYEAEEGLALLYSRQGKSDSVISIYRRLISEFPNARNFYHLKLTSALTEMEDYNACIGECIAIIATSSGNVSTRVDSLQVGIIYVDLAHAYEALRRYQDAIKTYNDFLVRRIAPDFDSWAHLSLGRLYEAEGDTKDAITEYRWVVARNAGKRHVEMARDRLKDLGEKP